VIFSRDQKEDETKIPLKKKDASKASGDSVKFCVVISVKR
jgi:hypothetical protein